MGDYVRAAYLAVGMLLPLLALLRWLHPYPPTQDLALGFLLGMFGTPLVLLISRIWPWPGNGLVRVALTTGVLEEGVKLLLGGMLLHRVGSEARLGPVEGALVLAFLGAGFEAVEDFQYLVGWVARGTPLLQVLAARALPLHLALGLVIGGYLAKGMAGNPLWLVWAWALAVGLHGGFNAVASYAPLPWAAGYAALVLAWGLISFLRNRRRSPWGLTRAIRRMDPWEAGVAVQELGWGMWEQLALERRSPAGWVVAMGLGILYPIMVLALGLLLQAVVGI